MFSDFTMLIIVLGESIGFCKVGAPGTVRWVAEDVDTPLSPETTGISRRSKLNSLCESLSNALYVERSLLRM